MIKKLGNIFFALLSIVMIPLMLLWIHSVSLLFVRERFYVCFLYLALLILLFVFRKYLKGVGTFLLEHKIIIYILMFLFQLIMLISTSYMVRSDAAYTFNCALGTPDYDKKWYLSGNPNNIVLYVYEKIFILLFKDSAIWVMQIINIFYSLIAIHILYLAMKKHISKKSANLTFVLFSLAIGITPQSLTLYSDVMILPVISILIYLMWDLFKLDFGVEFLVKLIIISLLNALAFHIRPTVVIVCIAFFMVMFLKGKVRNSFIVVLAMLICFFPVYALYEAGTEHINDYQKGRGKNLLSFIDLGLTYGGGNQVDFQEGLSMFVNEDTKVSDDYDGRYSKEVVLQDIKRRLKEYTPTTFMGHLFLKYSITVKFGNFGWNYVDDGTEINYYINPLYEKLKDNSFLEFIRNYFVYQNRDGYRFFKAFNQFVWLIISILVLITIIKKINTKEDDFALLALFGGLMFLMIFEGGKSRYMIQFLPQILVLAGMAVEKGSGYLHLKDK